MSGKYLLQIAAGSMHDLFLNLWKILIEQNMKIMKIAVSVDSLMSYLSLTLCILST